MNKALKTSLIVGMFFFIPLYVHAQITRTLTVGSRGVDVKELQVFLNSDPDTRIAASGVGSPGYESMYFGTRTMLAVKKLQIKYAYDTLTPAGLSVPTGVVGAYTRALIYKVQQSRLFATPAIDTTTSATAPRITAITPSVVGRAPQALTITGSGFTPTANTVIISSEAEGGITNVSSSDGKTLTVSFSFSGAKKIREQLATVPSDKRAAVATALIKNIQDPVRVIVVVQNANGTSAQYPLSINLASMIL